MERYWKHLYKVEVHYYDRDKGKFCQRTLLVPVPCSDNKTMLINKFHELIKQKLSENIKHSRFYITSIVHIEETEKEYQPGASEGVKQ